MLLLIVAYTRSSSDPYAFRQFAQVLPYAGLRGLTPAVVVLLITGAWMVLGGVGWSSHNCGCNSPLDCSHWHFWSAHCI